MAPDRTATVGPDIDPRMLSHFEEQDVFYMNPICWFATVLILYVAIALLWVFRDSLH